MSFTELPFLWNKTLPLAGLMTLAGCLGGCQTTPPAPESTEAVPEALPLLTPEVEAAPAEAPPPPLTPPAVDKPKPVDPNADNRLVIHYPHGGVHIDASHDEDGNLHGRMRIYYPNGRLFEESIWDGGYLVKVDTFNAYGVSTPTVVDGSGWRPILSGGTITRYEFYNNGIMVGSTLD